MNRTRVDNVGKVNVINSNRGVVRTCAGARLLLLLLLHHINIFISVLKVPNINPASTYCEGEDGTKR